MREGIPLCNSIWKKRVSELGDVCLYDVKLQGIGMPAIVSHFSFMNRCSRKVTHAGR